MFIQDNALSEKLCDLFLFHRFVRSSCFGGWSRCLMGALDVFSTALMCASAYYTRHETFQVYVFTYDSGVPQQSRASVISLSAQLCNIARGSYRRSAA